MTMARRVPTEVPAAIAPLAVLPVFLNLKGRRAVVVGGSPAAAWKAELLAAAGAQVDVRTPNASPEMIAVAGRSAGAVTVTERVGDAASFSGAALAIIDATDEEEGAAMAALSRAAGVPCNVIDRPAFCDFQFGTIVNRSPVVIGISTAAAAPILGQTVRQRIEAVLPLRLASWAQLAADIRDRVTRMLAPGADRRRFWEDFASHAFSGRPAATHDTDAAIVAVTRADSRRGNVTLVGAGPGDAGLLTLRAVQALQGADVILFDDLVTPEVLELGRREAKRIAVGKRGARKSCRQEDINALLVELAVAGKRVVRLKSGDPMVFGRAGEEIEALAAAGIATEIVPGITAASAMASRLGVSLTHRDHARSVRFVTGHSRDGSLPDDLDWQGLADARTSLVVYMGGATAPTLANRLIRHGLDPATPVVTAEAISRPDERITRLALGDLASGASSSGDGPLLIGIGPAFATPMADPRRL